MKLRSLLYVPANNARFIGKAHTHNADAIILDLEDSVPSEQKSAARDELAKSIKQVAQSGTMVFVRINADIETAKKDATAALNGGAFGIMIAKANAEKIQLINLYLNKQLAKNQSMNMRFIALLEDPAAILDASNIAKQTNMFGMLVGGEDLATSINASPSPEMLNFPKQFVHYAAKANGLLSFGLIRSVADYKNLVQITSSASEAKKLGYDGSTCIHPSSVKILNEHFMPSDAEIIWAKAVLKAIKTQTNGVIIVDNKMVDLPIIKRAKQILSWNNNNL